jgi:hypothetical protein
MFTKKAIFILAMVLSLATVLLAQSKGTIVAVFDPSVIDTDTGEPPDMQWIYVLEDEGYDVIYFYNASLSTAEQATLDTLLNANLIIVGRRVPSLALGDHKDAWNGLQTPLMTQNTWGLRSNRLNWFNTESIVGIAEEETIYNAIIDEPDDPVFKEIDLADPVPWVFSPFEVMGTTEAGNGTMLAHLESDNSVLFVRFEPDIEFYDGSVDYPAGPRTLIGNGRDVSSGPPFDYYNFTEEGEKVFLAEVQRMVILGGGPSAVKKDVAKPTVCSLDQNYPNPFNPTTNIEFTLSKAGHTTLQVFNIEGKLVETLVDNNLDTGRHTVQFAANDLSSGVYYYSIKHDGFTDVKKMALIK